MPWVRHDLYVKLLRDDAEWQKLMQEQHARGMQLANEAAAAREQSLTTLWNSSQMEAQQLRQDLDEATALNQQLQDSQDLQIREVALMHASSATAPEYIKGLAQEFEVFLRGSVAVEAEEVALINSGWNSAIEYLLQGEDEGSLDASYIASLRR